MLLYAFDNYRGIHKRLYETLIQEGLELYEIEDVTQRWKLTQHHCTLSLPLDCRMAKMVT